MSVNIANTRAMPWKSISLDQLQLASQFISYCLVELSCMESSIMMLKDLHLYSTIVIREDDQNDHISGSSATSTAKSCGYYVRCKHIRSRRKY